MGDLRGFNVDPTGQPTPGTTSPAVREQGSMQMQQLGQAIEKGGEVAASIYTDQLKQANALRVDEAMNALKEKQLDYTFGQNGFTQLHGRDALFRPDGKPLTEEYGGMLDKDADGIAAGLSNDVQRQAFARGRAGLGIAFRADVEKHEAGEFQTYSLSVTEGVIANRQRELGLGYADPAKTEAATMSIRAQVAQQGKLLGRSAEWVQARTVETLSPGHELAVATMLDKNDVSAAEKYVNAHRDEMTSDGVFKVDAAIGQEQDMQVSTSKANQIFAGGVTAARVAAPEDVMMPTRGEVVPGGSFGVARRADSHGVGAHAHAGIDIRVAQGSALSAPISGTVKTVTGAKGYGNELIIVSPDGKTEARLGHLSEFGVKDGDAVVRGQVVGKSGGTPGTPGAGNATGPHVHYELRVNGVAVDPSGQHRTAGGGTSGATSNGSLLSMIQAARADPELASNPRRLNETINQLRTLYSAREEGEQNAEKDAVNGGYMWLAQNPGKSWNDMPASMRASIPGSHIPGMQSYASALVKRPELTEEQGLPLWGKLKEAAARGQITSVDELIQYGPMLTPGQYKDVANDVTAAQKGDKVKLDSMQTTQQAIGYVDVELDKAGVDKKDHPDEYSKFRGTLLQQISAAERLKGAPLTGQEARAVALGLLADTGKSSGWFGTGWGAKTSHAYQGDHPKIAYDNIPDDARRQIAQSLQRQGKMFRPSDIERTYNEYAGAYQQ